MPHNISGMLRASRRPLTHCQCLEALASLRWARQPTCPYCHGQASIRLKREARWHCKICNTSFSATAGTLFHKTKVPLDRWFRLIVLMVRDGARPSVRATASAFRVNRNTAAFMLRRIRKAMLDERELIQAIGGGKWYQARQSEPQRTMES